MNKAEEFEKSLKTLLKAHPPTTIEAVTYLLDHLITSAARVIAFEAGNHIQEHDGYDCAEEMLNSYGQLLEARAREAMDLYLEAFELPPMPTSEVNRKTRESIMGMLEHDS